MSKEDPFPTLREKASHVQNTLIPKWVATRCMRRLVTTLFHKDEANQAYHAKSHIYSFAAMDKMMREALEEEVPSADKLQS